MWYSCRYVVLGCSRKRPCWCQAGLAKDECRRTGLRHLRGSSEIGDQLGRQWEPNRLINLFQDDGLMVGVVMIVPQDNQCSR